MADKKISQLTGATLPLAGTEVLPLVQSGTTKKVATDDLTVKNVRSNATTGILQVAGPAAGATRTMTVPDANFTAARTDASQTFTNTQEFTQDSASSQIRLTRTGSFAGTALMGTNEFVTIAFNNGSVDQFFINRNAAANSVEITSDNNLKVLSGKGIDFSANSHAAGMTSELLNWYEEGAWTPTIAASTGTITSYTSSGTYTRVGRQVTLLGTCTITNAGTGAGFLSISGLPFNVAGALASGCGREVALTGDALAANYSSATAIDLNVYNNATMPVTGRVFSFVLTYFA